LSNDLTQITTEIKTYQSIGGQAIFEIGKRLKKVKDEDLAHGQYLNWLKSINLDRKVANKFMKVSTELTNDSTYSHLGMNSLYLIATMPEEEREKPQQLDSGETKTPDEMTVKELRETKKKLKEKEELLNNKDKTIERQSRMIDDLNEQETEVIEKEVEKIPEDYQKVKADFESYKKENEQLKNDMKKLRQQAKNEEDRKKRDEQQDKLQEMELKRLQREANINVYQFILATNEFIKDQSINAYDSGAIASASDETKEKLITSVQSLEKFIKEVKQEIKGEVAWVIN